MTSELKPCPFCGKSETLVWADAKQEEVCGRFDECEADMCLTGSVFCSVNNGGCGASGGFRYIKEEAIAAWNTRCE